VRAIGARLVLGAVARKDRLEHANRPVDRLTRRLAAFAPAALTPPKN